MSQIINFVNGLATLKDSASANPIDESAMRNVAVYARLVMAKGSSMAKPAPTIKKQFSVSTSGKFINAELFWLNANGVPITDHRVFVSVEIAKSDIIRNEQFYYVQLLHPTIDLSKDEVVTFK